MMEDIRRLLDAYHAWLKDKSAIRQIDQWVEITTPYLDRHNDYLQIYARPANGGYLLTDDGYTIGDLEQNGCRLESKKRQDLLRMTATGFGVRLEDKTLQVCASADDFALRKHSLIQTMLAVEQVDYAEIQTTIGRQWIPQFVREIEDLDQKLIRISGYMIPLGYAEEQTHFLISASPGDGCYFHLPGGPESVIEVRAQKGVEFTCDTIEIEGKLSVLRDDPFGLLYRMEDALPVR